MCRWSDSTQVSRNSNLCGLALPLLFRSLDHLTDRNGRCPDFRPSYQKPNNSALQSLLRQFGLPFLLLPVSENYVRRRWLQFFADRTHTWRLILCRSVHHAFPITRSLNFFSTILCKKWGNMVHRFSMVFECQRVVEGIQIAENITETCQKYFQSFIAIEILPQNFCQLFQNISLQHYNFNFLKYFCK